SSRLSVGVDRGPHEVGNRNPRDLHRVLETQENSLMGSLLGFEFGKIFPFEEDLSAGDLIFFFTSNHRREGTFSGTVRPHDGVYFSRMDFQIDTFKNL